MTYYVPIYANLCHLWTAADWGFDAMQVVEVQSESSLEKFGTVALPFWDAGLFSRLHSHQVQCCKVHHLYQLALLIPTQLGGMLVRHCLFRHPPPVHCFWPSITFRSSPWKVSKSLNIILRFWDSGNEPRKSEVCLYALPHRRLAGKIWIEYEFHPLIAVW